MLEKVTTAKRYIKIPISRSIFQRSLPIISKNATGKSMLSIIGKAYSPNKIHAHRVMKAPIVDDGSIKRSRTTKKPIPHHQMSDPNSCVTRGFLVADFLRAILMCSIYKNNKIQKEAKPPASGRGLVGELSIIPYHNNRKAWVNSMNNITYTNRMVIGILILHMRE